MFRLLAWQEVRDGTAEVEAEARTSGVRQARRARQTRCRRATQPWTALPPPPPPPPPTPPPQPTPRRRFNLPLPWHPMTATMTAPPMRSKAAVASTVRGTVPLAQPHTRRHQRRAISDFHLTCPARVVFPGRQGKCRRRRWRRRKEEARRGVGCSGGVLTVSRWVTQTA